MKNENQKQLSLAKHEAKLSEWRERVRECRNSGMKVTEWCAKNGINEKTYYRWQQEIWERENLTIQANKESEVQFVDVPQIAIQQEYKRGGIIILNRGWRIELQNDADPEFVVRIMQEAARYV